MTDGTEFSEAEVKPIKEEVEASPEKVAEVKEAAEVQHATDEATHTPEATTEKMEHAHAEDLQKTFVEAVPLAQPPEIAPAASAAEETVSPPETPRAAQEDMDQGEPAEKQSEGDQEAASEVKSEAAEVSTAAPTITLEGAEEEGNVTIERAAVEQSESGGTGQPEIQEKAADQTPETPKAATAETASVPNLETVHREGDEPKLVITDPDADDGSFNPDDSYDQAGDIREDTRISDQYGGVVDERGGAVGYLGESGRAVEGIPEIPGADLDITGALTGRGGPGEVDLPFEDKFTTDTENEILGLAGSAAPGANPLISTKGADDTNTSTKGAAGSTTTSSNDTGTSTAADATTPTQTTPAASTSNTSQGQYRKDGEWVDVPAGTAPGKRKATVRLTAGRLWDRATSWMGGSSDDGRQSGHIGVRGTPTPDSVEEVNIDHTLGGLIPDPIPDASPEDDLDDESVMQPVDEDSANPKEPGVVFDRATQTDPYSQYTDDHVDIPAVVTEDEYEDKTDWVKGAGFDPEDGGGIISTESDQKNLADNEDAANLNAADLSSDGQVPKP